ncbi:MAG: polysaccharide biosynthesis protein [Arcobacteraceae bacterium]
MKIRQTVAKRRLFFILSDILIIFASVWLSFALRFDFAIPKIYIDEVYFSFFFLAITRVSFSYFLHIYDISWRHFSLSDLVKLNYIFIFSTTLFLIFTFVGRYIDIIIPRSIIAIEFFVSLFLILFLKISKRFYLEFYRNNIQDKDTIIIASGDRANIILKTITGRSTGYNPIAIIDDVYKNMRIGNIPVYSFDDFLSKDLECDAAIVDDTVDIQNIYSKLKDREVEEIKIASAYSDYGVKIHEVSVEDLLARHPKDLDKTAIENFIQNKTVLITGAGGSIGSEIARQCGSFGAKKLILLDHSEYNLYSISEELDMYKPILIMQSVVNKELLDLTFAKYKPEIVIHAAAYKHVPLVEENIYEAILNNIIGTKNTIDVAIKYGAEKFVLISTDKAVRPTNVMGTTKRICELYLQNVLSGSTEVVAVRFGNVLGSSGSVIPKFKAQIEAGGPITVTHPDVTRYFMLIPEACELVLQAGAIGQGGEIFILDMGEPIKIVDLANKMCELSGREDIQIEFSGLRPGEKLYEELLINDSDAKTKYESITVASKTIYDINKLNMDIEELISCDYKLEKLKNIVPEFKHNIAR